MLLTLIETILYTDSLVWIRIMDFNTHFSEQFKLEACQRWFLKKLFNLPEHAPSHSLYNISGLLTLETLIDQRKFFFSHHYITYDASTDQ